MVTEEHVRQYREEGYTVVRGLLTPEESAVYRAESHALIERLEKIKNTDATWGAARAQSAETKIHHCHDVQFESAALGRLILDARLADAFSALMGTPNVQLHHNKLFIKPPEKGSPFPMHQDKPFFPHDNDTMMAAILHFDDAPLEKGCVRVVPGTHKSDLQHSSDGAFHLDQNEWRVEDALPIEAKAGDVLFFHYMTVHGSGVNESPDSRTTLLIQVRDPEDPMTIDTHRSRGQGAMLAGVDPRASLPTPKPDGTSVRMGMM